MSGHREHRIRGIVREEIAARDARVRAALSLVGHGAAEFERKMRLAADRAFDQVDRSLRAQDLGIALGGVPEGVHLGEEHLDEGRVCPVQLSNKQADQAGVGGGLEAEVDQKLAFGVGHDGGSNGAAPTERLKVSFGFDPASVDAFRAGFDRLGDDLAGIARLAKLAPQLMEALVAKGSCGFDLCPIDSDPAAALGSGFVRLAFRPRDGFEALVAAARAAHAELLGLEKALQHLLVTTPDPDPQSDGESPSVDKPADGAA